MMKNEEKRVKYEEDIIGYNGTGADRRRLLMFQTK